MSSISIKITASIIISIGLSISLVNNFQAGDNSKQVSKQLKDLQYTDRGDRMEGLDPPFAIAGADIQIEAAWLTPIEDDSIRPGDTIEIKFFQPEGETYVIDVKERQLNYLMRPHPSQIINGVFSWSVDEVLIPCMVKNAIGLRYNDLLAIAKNDISTPRCAYVSPIILSKNGLPKKPQAYRFFFRTNVDVRIRYTFYYKAGENMGDWIMVKDDAQIKESARSSFPIDWDGLLKDSTKAPFGHYLLKLEGIASMGPIHEDVGAECYFYHNINP